MNRTFENLPDAKRDRITRAAVEEFGRAGYAAASINAIVSRLGIAKGSIFQYFGDKKGLFLFVFGQATDMVKDYLRTVREETADQDLFTRLEATLVAGLMFLDRHPQMYRLYIKMLFEDALPFRDEIMGSLRRYSFKYLRGLLSDARDRGETPPDLDLDQAAFLLDAIMDRFLQTRTLPHLDAGLGLSGGSGEEARRWISGVVGLLRRGLGASTREGGA